MASKVVGRQVVKQKDPRITVPAMAYWQLQVEGNLARRSIMGVRVYTMWRRDVVSILVETKVSKVGLVCSQPESASRVLLASVLRWGIL